MAPPKASFTYCMCHPVSSPWFNPCGRRLQAYSTTILTPWADTVKYMLCTSQLSIHPELPTVYSTHTSPQFHHLHNACKILQRFDASYPVYSESLKLSCSSLGHAHDIMSLLQHWDSKHCQKDSTSFQHHCPSPVSVPHYCFVWSGKKEKPQKIPPSSFIEGFKDELQLAHEKVPIPASTPQGAGSKAWAHIRTLEM